MLCANIVGGVEPKKRRAFRSSFDGGPSVGFFAFHDANDSGNCHAGFASGFNRVDGRSAGGADVVDDHHARAFAAEAFDAASGAVRLFCFAHQEAVDAAAIRG